MSISQNFIINKNISVQSFNRLYNFWKEVAENEGQKATFLTEKFLFSLDLEKKNQLRKASQSKKFCLLLTPQFTALLLGKLNKVNKFYQISITFDRNAIADYFKKVTKNYRVTPDFLKTLQNQNTLNSDNYWIMNKFTCQIVNILTANPMSEDYPNLLNNFTLEQLINFEREQEEILNQIKNKIIQQEDLKKIIQTTIERVCYLLSLDRLVVYQLNVPISKSNDGDTSLKDIVTYEAKKSNQIDSVLHFQDEICFQKYAQSKRKYHKGFSLIVNDIETEMSISVCLQELMRKLNIKAKVVTPINIQNQLWGFLIAHQCQTPRQWQNREIEFFKQITDYLATAIHQHQFSQQLQVQQQVLEEQINLKTKQLQNALLAAQVASQSKHEFLGSISHELRTPLTCIIGLSGTLLHWSLAKGNIPLPIEKQQQYLKTIQDSGKQLLSLINNILEVSELESGQYLLNISRLSLKNLAQNVLQCVENDARKSQISLNLEFKVKTEQDFFHADLERLEEILLNLLSNGIKFTPAGGEVILRIWKEQRQVIFQVEDNGIGISQQQQPLIFEKFKQLEGFLQRTHGGVGLGLALTKQLVELHGGNISVESVVGKGSIFTVYLPNQTLKKIHKDKHSQTKTIILIAQHEANATLLCQLTTAAGYQTVWLINIETVIEQINILNPNLLLIEQSFSQAEIQHLKEQLLEINPSYALKLVQIISDPDRLEKNDSFVQGLDDYLSLAMNPSELIKKIDTLVR